MRSIGDASLATGKPGHPVAALTMAAGRSLRAKARSLRHEAATVSEEAFAPSRLGVACPDQYPDRVAVERSGERSGERQFYNFHAMPSGPVLPNRTNQQWSTGQQGEGRRMRRP